LFLFANKVSQSNVQNHLILARKIIKSLNVSRTYFIDAFNLSQKLSLIAGICVYDCKPIHVSISIEGFSLSVIGLGSWLLYGILLKNKPLIIANVVGVVGAVLVLVGTFIYG